MEVKVQRTPQLRLRTGIIACRCSYHDSAPKSEFKKWVDSVDKMRNMIQAKNMKSTWHVQFVGTIVSKNLSMMKIDELVWLIPRFLIVS